MSINTARSSLEVPVGFLASRKFLLNGRDDGSKTIQRAFFWQEQGVEEGWYPNALQAALPLAAGAADSQHEVACAGTDI